MSFQQTQRLRFASAKITCSGFARRVFAPAAVYIRSNAGIKLVVIATDNIYKPGFLQCAIDSHSLVKGFVGGGAQNRVRNVWPFLDTSWRGNNNAKQAS